MRVLLFLLALAIVPYALADRDNGRCGDGYVDRGEECDDGNAVNTDTCSNTCRINSDPFPTCAPTVQTNVVNQLGSTGSVGTANLLSDCPAGMVAAGLYGRAEPSPNWVSRFGARCAPLLVNSSATAVVSRGTLQDAASLGRTTGTNSAQDCPANQFLIGVNLM